jgi:pimeloyl-ACP methyl ester carboxylesterase
MIEKKEIQVNGLKVVYRIKGEGKPLLILHGWGVSSKLWEKIMEGITNRKVICPDIPGFGESDTPKEAWNVSKYASWLKAFVNELDLDYFDVIAHSFGGRIMIKFLQNNQSMVNKLILHGPAGIRTKLNIKQKIIKNGSNISPRFIKVAIKKVLDPLLKDKDYSKAQGIMKEIMRNIIEEDLFPYLNNIHNDTLLIWGEHDNFVSLEQARMFESEIDRSKLVIISEAGHSAFRTHPDKFLEIVLSFLN